MQGSRPLSDGDISRLVGQFTSSAYDEGSSSRYPLFVAMGVRTGMRRGEQLTIRVIDIARPDPAATENGGWTPRNYISLARKNTKKTRGREFPPRRRRRSLS